MTAYKRDRYKMSAFEYMDAAGGDVEQACQYAIAAAEERTRIFALPCTWEARLSEDGNEIIVTRTRKAAASAASITHKGAER